MKKFIAIAVICMLSFASLESKATIVIHANIGISISIQGHEQVIVHPSYIEIICHPPKDVSCVLILPNDAFPIEQGELIFDESTYPVDINYTVDESDRDNSIYSFPRIR